VELHQFSVELKFLALRSSTWVCCSAAHGSCSEDL